MEKPLVCCIMLVNGRLPMVKRAVASYQAQTYENKRLLIWNTGPSFFNDWPEAYGLPETIWTPDVDAAACSKLTVGELRNIANRFASTHYGPIADRPDILAHWDSDDWSHPRRIEEQVALLEQTKADAVGYSDMLFWRTCEKCNAGRANTLPECPHCHLKYDPTREVPAGEAWLYKHRNPNYCLGTSLCYRREVWQQVPFLALPNAQGSTGEEYYWLKKVNAAGACSCGHAIPGRDVKYAKPYQPRMIASIHGGNTQYYGEDMLKSYTEFQRVETWDAHCRKVMEL